MGTLYREVHCGGRCTGVSMVGALYREVHCGSAAQGSLLWSRSTRKSIVGRSTIGLAGLAGAKVSAIVFLVFFVFLVFNYIRHIVKEIYCGDVVHRSPLWGALYRCVHCGSAAQGSPLWERCTRKFMVERCTRKSIVGRSTIGLAGLAGAKIPAIVFLVF